MKLRSFLLDDPINCLPTFLAGGFDALLLPYTYHMNRASEPASLPNVIMSILNMNTLSEKTMGWIFLGLQLLASAISLLFRIDSFEKLARWWILVVGGFILFSRIFSPQWILWVLPLILLVIEDAFDMGLTILYGILTYVAFLLAYDGIPPILLAVHLSNLALLLILMLRSAGRLDWKIANPLAYS